jgi:hypothetical protein
MRARRIVTMLAGIALWTLSSLAAFGPWGASAIALLGLSCAEIAVSASTLVRFETNALYVGMGLRGLANSLLALAAWRQGSAAQGYLGTVLFGSSALSFLLSFAPRVRSITAVAVRLRKFPAWFGATKAYRVMDIGYTSLWASVWAAAAIASQTGHRAAAIDLVAIAGLSSEAMCLLLLQAFGYRYLDFLSGKAARDPRP